MRSRIVLPAPVMYIHRMPSLLVRKQLYLTREQERRLKKLAARRRKSEADLVREALDRYLGLRTKENFEDDPLWDIVGSARSDGKRGVDEEDDDIYTLP